MLNLTEISINARKYFLWAGIAFVILIILRVIIGLTINYIKSIRTKTVSVAAPDVKFDKLPAPKFTSATNSSSGLTFTLQNIEGRPPETTPSGRVYPMPKKLPSFLAPDNAKKLAAKLGFTSDPVAVKNTFYRFVDPAEPLRTLNLDIVTMNFQLKYDYSKNHSIFNIEKILLKEDALNQVKNFISSNGLFDSSISKGIITTESLTYNPTSNSFSPAISLGASNAVRINFFREDLDGLKVIPNSFKRSFNYALYTLSSKRKYEILELSYTFWPIAFDDYSTYPLKSGAEAWQDLLDGYAFVVNMGSNTSDKPIVIRDIYLAYYDSEEPQQYLMPIFVFEGDNNFVAYLSAVSNEWLE